MDTVSTILDKYKDLKELFSVYINDTKEDRVHLNTVLSEIKDKINELVLEQVNIRAELKNVLREIEWDRKDFKSIRDEFLDIKQTIVICPICSGKVNVEQLLKDVKTAQTQASTAKTKTTIAIALLFILIVALITHLTTISP